MQYLHKFFLRFSALGQNPRLPSAIAEGDCGQGTAIMFLCTYPESNWDYRLRRPVLYPLSYRCPSASLRVNPSVYPEAARSGRSAEGRGVEPLSPCGHWFSKPTHYRPAHPPEVRPPRIELGSAVPQTATRSIKLWARYLWGYYIKFMKESFVSKEICISAFYLILNTGYYQLLIFQRHFFTQPFGRIIHPIFIRLFFKRKVFYQNRLYFFLILTIG